jgi:hypothetical protein
MSEMKTFVVTINDKSYTIREFDIDYALCSAYRKYHLGKVNVYDKIFWHLGTTKEVVTWFEVDEN